MPTFNFPKLTGGLCVDPSRPNECFVFDNIDINRDGYCITRQPTIAVGADGVFGASMCVGLGRVICPPATVPKIIVAKTGTTFYYFPTSTSNASSFSGSYVVPTDAFPMSGAVSSFTVPTSPLDDPVYFETMLDASFNSAVYMANPNFDHIVVWDGSAGSASNVGTSPAHPYLVCAFNNNLFTVSLDTPNVLQFSDIADPSTWPSTNKFQVSAKYGPIIALLAQDDRLYIFTSSAILYMVGDPTDPYVGVMHPYVTCVNQSCVSQFGSMAAFLGRDNNCYTLAGNVSIMSDALRGQVPAITRQLIPGSTASISLGPSSCAWAALTPSYYAVRACLNTNQATPKVATTTAAPAYLLINERQRYGYWGRFTYGSTTGVGQTQPFQAIVFYVPEWQALLLTSGNGNVYVQPLMDCLYVTKPSPLDAGTLSTAGLVPIVSAFQTYLLSPNGDFTMTNMFRKGLLVGSGSNVSVLGFLTDEGANANTLSFNTGGSIATFTHTSPTMPVEWYGRIDGSSSSQKLDFQSISFRVSATNMSLQQFDFDYTPQRRNFLKYI